MSEREQKRRRRRVHELPDRKVQIEMADARKAVRTAYEHGVRDGAGFALVEMEKALYGGSEEMVATLARLNQTVPEATP